MAIEQVGDQAGFDFAVLLGFELFGVAGVVRAAVGEDVAEDQKIFAVGRDDFAGGFGGKVGDLKLAGAIGAHAPDLGTAAGGAGVVNARAVGRPAGAIGGVAQFAGRAAGERHGPDAVGGAVVIDVGLADAEGDGLAVGRELGIADALDAEKGVDVEGALLGESILAEEQGG